LDNYINTQVYKKNSDETKGNYWGVCSVPIDETYHTYGRMINRSVYAFYDFKTDSETVDLDSIEGSAVLFKLMVIKDAVTKGYWGKIGIKELPEDLKEPVPFFKQEVGLPNDCSIIFVEGSNIKKVSPEDCVGLERFADWEHDHVEQSYVIITMEFEMLIVIC
jgi:hypothetical protein